MSWPIGYAKTGVYFSTSTNGVISADGVPITDVNGWLELPLPLHAQTAQRFGTYSLRIRLSVDARGAAFFYAEQVELGGQRYAGVHALAQAEGAAWLSGLGDDVQRVIEGRRLSRTAPTPHPLSDTVPTMRRVRSRADADPLRSTLPLRSDDEAQPPRSSARPTAGE